MFLFMLSGLKIFVFVDNFAPVTETFVYDHVVKLSKRHHVSVGCINRSNLDRFPFDQVHEMNYPVSKIKRIIRSRLYKYHIRLNFFNPVFSEELSSLVEKLQPDVIHCHFGPKALMLSDNLKVGVFKGPIFATFHGFDATQLLKQRPAYRRRIKQLFKLPNFYPLFVSQHIEEAFRHYDLISNRGKILYIGTDTEFFRPAPKFADPIFTFVQISSFVEKKGHQYLVTAFAQLIKRRRPVSFRLILGGSGEKEEEIKALVKKLGIEKYVEFKGWMTRTEIKDVLNQADAFVHFSITSASGNQEGLPIAILEAMAMELPICSTFHSGIPELIEHGVNGLLVRERDINGYESALEAITKWGRQPQNREKVVKLFSQEKYLNQDLFNVYLRAIEDCDQN